LLSDEGGDEGFDGLEVAGGTGAVSGLLLAGPKVR